MAKLFADSNIDHRLTASYFPRCNGQVERLNQTIISSIRKHCENNNNEWDQQLDYLIFCYNTRVNSITKYSPYRLVFGIDPNIFKSYESEEATKTDRIELESRVNEIDSSNLNEREDAITNILKSQEKQIEEQNRNMNVQETQNWNKGVYQK